MKKSKQKTDSIAKVVATMKLARNLNCTFEEAAKKLKDMDKAI
ncbi:hypothetical protein [Clostridium swellfunianum]|nr:hypothetical protein [Clostridium swellfunianum]